MLSGAPELISLPWQAVKHLLTCWMPRCGLQMPQHWLTPAVCKHLTERILNTTESNIPGVVFRDVCS